MKVIFKFLGAMIAVLAPAILIITTSLVAGESFDWVISWLAGTYSSLLIILGVGYFVWCTWFQESYEKWRDNRYKEELKVAEKRAKFEREFEEAREEFRKANKEFEKSGIKKWNGF